jgi:hypothetical protein
MIELHTIRTVITATLHAWAESNPLRAEWLMECVRCHAAGDWGDLDPEDRAANDAAARNGEGRLLSAYRIPAFLSGPDHDDMVWIITDDLEDPDTATTLLMPSDY